MWGRGRSRCQTGNARRRSRANRRRHARNPRPFGHKSARSQELALMRASPLGPELAHDLDILARALTTTRERDAESLELFCQPSDGDAEGEPATTQAVDCCHGLGQHEGVVLGYETDTRRQPDPGCAGGRIGQCREGVGDRSVGWRRKVTTRVRILGRILFEQHDVLRRPNCRKTEPLGGGGDRPYPFGINRWPNTDCKISDLHEAYSMTRWVEPGAISGLRSVTASILSGASAAVKGTSTDLLEFTLSL